MTVIHLDFGRVPLFRSLARIGEILHQTVVVKNQNHELAVIQFQLKSVKPEPVILGMRIPRPGFGLSVPNNAPFNT